MLTVLMAKKELKNTDVTNSALVAASSFAIYDYYGHIWGIMRKIQLKDAKASLSAVVNQAARGKPSVITRHGKPEAVVLGIADWERLSRVPSFGRLLMAAPVEPEDLPARNRAPMRNAGL